MNVRFLKTALAVYVCACCSFAVNATIYTVGDGETYSITGTGGDKINVRGAVLDAQGGSTVVFSPTQSGSSWYASCWHAIQATNGIVTLDVSADTAQGCVRRLTSITCSGTGGFRVKGGTVVTFGYADDQSYPVFDADNFGFVDGEGNPVEGTVKFNSFAYISKLPSGEKCAYGFVNGCNVVFGGTNPFGLSEGDAWEIPPEIASASQCRLGNDTCIPAGCRIRVPTGRRLVVAPMETPNPLDERTFSPFSPVWSRQTVLATAVELSGGELLLDANFKGFAGTITGTGLVDKGSSLAREIVAGGGADLTISGDLAVKSAAGANVTVTYQNGNGCAFVDDGGTLTVNDPNAWQGAVVSWFDPSQTDTCQNVGHFTGHAGQYDFYYTNDYMLVEGLVDCRGASDSRNRLINDRLVSSGKIDEFPDFYPYLVTDGPNGLSYLSFGQYRGGGSRSYTKIADGIRSTKTDSMGERRRLWVTTGTSQSASTMTPKMVMMVFGSQQGGGAAMLGMENNVFKRGNSASTSMEHSLSDPITTCTTHDIWLDGEKVNPAETYFSGGWQIVTLDTTQCTFCGLGAVGNLGSHADSGGQNYGEILVFSSSLTEGQRVAAERYLAKKWGLLGQYKGGECAARIDLSGSGTLNAHEFTEVKVGGKFNGTVQLDGGTLAVPDELSPYTEATLPTENRVGWFDPDVRANVHTRGESPAQTSCPLLIQAIFDRDTGRCVEGAYFLQADAVRQPFLSADARGWGPVRNWVDFSHDLYPQLCDEEYAGNTFRMRVWGAGHPTYDFDYGQTCTQQGIPVKTVFAIQDSLRGGGTTVHDLMTGGNYIPSRITDNPSSKVFADGTVADITGGDIRLDGKTISATDGFTGGPELFSFSTVANTFPAGFIADWHSTQQQGGQNRDNVRHGEIIGELLFYGRKVAGDERKRIEAYLMGKWLGRMPEGCSDLSGMTVAGSGAVTSRTAARLPKFAADFAGTVSVTASTFDMTYDGTLSGAVLAPAATLDCPASCKITIDFLTRPAKGRYELVSAQNVKDIAWTLETMGDVGNRRLELVVDETANKVYLDVLGNGILLIFK